MKRSRVPSIPEKSALPAANAEGIPIAPSAPLSRVTADATFVGDLTALGYRLIDRWTNPDKECRVAFDPEHSLDHYHGLYFRLD